MLTDTTVIEQARRAAGLSQREMADGAGTQQSAVSEYEARKKSPTLEVVERLLEAADVELTYRPIIDFETRVDPEFGKYRVPERLWSVPMPECFSKVQVAGLLLGARRTRVWDLSVEAQRIDYYEWVITKGVVALMVDSVDGLLLMQVWDRLNIPGVIRSAWQPVLDAATASQDTSPRDPGGVSAWVTKDMGIAWKPIRKRKPRAPQIPIGRVTRDSPISIWRRYSSSTD